MKRRCRLCGRLARQPVSCPQCAAVCYCSEAHALLHRQQGHDADECGRLKAQLARTQEVWSHPFTWAQLAASDAGACQVLDRLGLHRESAWQSLCDCPPQSWGAAGARWLAAYRQGGPGLTLPDRLGDDAARQWEPGAGKLAGEGTAVTDWAGFYAARDLQASSPVALLVDVVLTLHWGLLQLPGAAQASRLTVHVLGCERELDEWPLLLELALLWTAAELQLVLVGTCVDSSLAGQRLEWPAGQAPRVSLQFVEGLYHEVSGSLPPPDLVFCPNAGIAAYASWRPTVAALLKSRTPAVVTDFCEEAAWLARQAVGRECELAGQRLPGRLQLNPFRSPLARPQEDCRLPTCGGCCLFWLQEPGSCVKAS